MNMWSQLIPSERPKHQPPKVTPAKRVKGPRSTKPLMTLTILGYIQEHPGCNSAEIRIAVDLPSGKLAKHLYRMEKDGRIRTEIRFADYKTPHSNDYIKHYWRVQ